MKNYQSNSDKIELLAPAGTLEVFEVAVESGADAIYIGAPFFNARELARHFTISEVAAMVDFGHRHGVKVYLAMNSLVKEDEVVRAVETLAVLEQLQPDGLIIQDLGLYRILKKYFPGMRIHASTLMAAHNVAAVNKLANMGYSRVVLPREVTIDEISRISASTNVELEVFVHGAMCFSYSGLCLFSSFQGGRSSLRGRCVQPCRRRYTWQGKGKGLRSGYLFSMSDLAGIDLLPDLIKAGVTSLKIEGRMRSASYVGNVVKAYRTVLDAPPGDKNAQGVAQQLLDSAMGRKATRGYFPTSKPQDVLTPQYSGNIGIFLGKVKLARGATLMVNAPLTVGDRLRLHQEKSGERHGFSIKKIKVAGKFVDQAEKGTIVSLDFPKQVRDGDTVYKVDSADQRGKKSNRITPERFSEKMKALATGERVRQIVASLSAGTGRDEKTVRPVSGRKSNKPGGKGSSRFIQSPLPLWFRADDPLLLTQRFQLLPERVVINLSGESFNRFFRMKKFGPLFRRIVWALPSIIDEDKWSFFAERIGQLIELGFREWQIGHLSQTGFFEGLGCRLYGDYTLNILNSLAEKVIKDNSLHGAILSIENDRANLSELCRSAGDFQRGMTVYGFPALFTSRYSGPPMQYDRVFQSPKGESFVLRQAWGYTRALPIQPFSLMAELTDLAKMGVDYGVVDLSGQIISMKNVDNVFRQMNSQTKGLKFSSFNFHHNLS